MVRFGGRSKHTYSMLNKPISEGYRILALCWKGYTWNWLYTSRVSGIAAQQPYTGSVHLTPTSAAICEMIKTLPYTSNLFNVYMDNYFTNVPLFQVLCSHGIGACGTAWKNKNAFPPELHNDYPNLPWNHLCGAQIGSYENPVLVLQWEDSGSVHMLTTIHRITEHVNRERKKPRTTSTNATITCRAFQPSSQRQVFAIPQVIDDYNQFINGVDRADQLRASYPSQLKVQRNWLPLFYWLLDTSIVNSFILFRLLHPQARHRAFRIDLVRSLYTYSSPSIAPVKPSTGYAKKDNYNLFQ